MHHNYIKKKKHNQEQQQKEGFVITSKLMQYDREKNECTMLLVQQQV